MLGRSRKPRLVKACHGGVLADGRPVLWKHTRALAHVRILWAALVLWVQGHKRAARIMRQWTCADPSPDAIAKAKANFTRRFPG